MGTIANIKNNTQIRIPRSFIVKSIKNLPSKIELRDSTQSLSAQKLGIKIDQLKELGISENGICLPKLRFALGKRIPDEIKLRKGEGRTKDNVTSVIVGRLGKEEIVFKARFGLNILNRIRLISASYKALGLFNILWSDVRELPFAISAFIKFTSRMTTVSLFDISSRPTFIADIVQELYPGKVPLQGRFLTRIIKAQYFDAHSQGKYSSKVAKALCSNIFSQGKFIGETAKTLYADIASQVIFIRGATKELYPDNILSQGVFMGELIRTLYSDDISSQIMLVTEIAKMSCSEEISLQGAFIAQLVKGVCYSDVSLKERYKKMFIAESAKGLYSDIASQVKFILGAVKEFYPNNVASQIDFTGETVKTLYSNRSSQIKFIEIAIRELCQDNMLLQIYFVEKMTKILSNGDISSQGKFVGELAKVLYCDKFSLIQFILKIIKESYNGYSVPLEFVVEVSRTLFSDIPSQVKFIAGIAEWLHPDNAPSQDKILLEAAIQFYPNNICLFIKEVSKTIYSDIHSQGRLIAKIVEILFSDSTSQIKFLVGIANELHTNDISSQGKFFGEITRELNSDNVPSIIRVKFIAESATDIYSDISSRAKFVSGAANILSNGDISFQGRFVGNVAKMLYDDFPSQVKFAKESVTALYSDIPSQIQLIGEAAKVIFYDISSSMKFIVEVFGFLNEDYLNRIAEVFEIEPEEVYELYSQIGNGFIKNASK